MCKQNAKKANKTAKIHASCHVVGYTSKTKIKNFGLSIKCWTHNLHRSNTTGKGIALKLESKIHIY